MGFLGWAIFSLIVSLIAGALGFTGLARDAAALSKLFFFIFLAIAILLFVLIGIGIGVSGPS